MGGWTFLFWWPWVGSLGSGGREGGREGGRAQRGKEGGRDVPIVEVKGIGVGMDVDERVGLSVDEAADLGEEKEGGREGGREGGEKMSGVWKDGQSVPSSLPPSSPFYAKLGLVL